MKALSVVSVKDFKEHATTIIRNIIEKGKYLILTKRNKPIAFIEPFDKNKEAEICYLTSQIGKLLKSANITEKEAQNALKSARKEVYGS